MNETAKNRYAGVNPHLMSLLQTRGTADEPSDYPVFHSYHISQLADYLNEILPAPFRALPEPSLQIRERDTGDEQKFKPDVGVVRKRNGTGATTTTPMAIADAPDIVIPLPLAEVQTYNAVGLYHVTETSRRGKLVLWIEVLSPANMPGGSYYEAYQANREKSWESQIPLLEFDYLHESPPIDPAIPKYPDASESQPYVASLSNPITKQMEIYFGRINQLLPTLALPLGEGKAVALEWERVYQRVFEKGRFGEFDVDYGEEPARMHTYSPEDQARIRETMQMIAGQSER